MTPSRDAPTEPSKEAHEAGKKLIGALVIMHGMGIFADRLNEAENEAALALDRFRAAGVREERERCAQYADEIGQLRSACPTTADFIANRIRSGASP